MHKRIPLFLAACLMSGSAFASGDWTGWYLGGHVGRADGSADSRVSLGGQWSSESQALRDDASPELILNHRRFLARLDDALILQREELARCAQRLEEAHRAWQAVRTRRRAFEVLEARADAEALAQAQRLAQKMLDEHASQKHLRRARGEGADER